MPRLFIALDLPPGPRGTLIALAAGIPEARWVTREQLHLTLRFLGSVADETLPDLKNNLSRVAAPAFRTSLAGVGVFPPVPTRRKPARVLWAGLAPAEPVRALKQAIDAVIDAVLGPDPESASHGFSPHVTLARFKEPPAPEPLAHFLQQHRLLSSEPFAIESFQLYESPHPARRARVHGTRHLPAVPGEGSNGRVKGDISSHVETHCRTQDARAMVAAFHKTKRKGRRCRNQNGGCYLQA